MRHHSTPFTNLLAKAGISRAFLNMPNGDPDEKNQKLIRLA